jgi:hypothetical protein
MPPHQNQTQYWLVSHRNSPYSITMTFRTPDTSGRNVYFLV